jgi:hypothetical protein
MALFFITRQLSSVHFFSRDVTLFLGSKAYSVRSFRRKWRSVPGDRCFTSVSDNQNDSQPSLRRFPLIGIFIDLDNVTPDPSEFTRPNLARWIRPLVSFARTVGTPVTIQGFMNEHTATYEAGRVEHLDQEWWPTNNNEQFPNAIVQTGFDSDGTLRCGICGACMKLSKKDLKRDMTLLDKLNQHMKTLHDREQAKRVKCLNSLPKEKRNRLLQGSKGDQMRKYKAAQVGLGRQGAEKKFMQIKNIRKRNDLLQILKEEGIQCHVVNDVDSVLIKKAKQWMKAITIKLQREKDINIRDSDWLEDGPVAALLVVTEDSDFVPLLKAAKSINFCAVSASPITTQQTRRLVLESDLVLVRESEDSERIVPRANTFIGSQLLLNLDSSLPK